MQYNFVSVEKCNMCGASASNARVLGRRMNGSQGKRPTKRIGVTTSVVRCRRCDLIYSNPMPVPASIDQHYGSPPEAYWNASYFKIDPEYFKPQIDRFFELHPERSHVRALDVGAGIGKCMVALRERGFDAYGFEPSEPFYQRALDKMSIAPDHLQLASVEEAQYPKDHFDFITFGAVLEHLYDPSAAILKTMEWLKPNGLLHIEVPSAGWLTNKIYNLIYRVQGLDYVGNISPMHAPFHLYEFGLKSFQQHAKNHGYKIAHHEFMVAMTYLPRVLDPIVKPYMEKTDTGMQLEIWLRKSA